MPSVLHHVSRNNRFTNYNLVISLFSRAMENDNYHHLIIISHMFY